VRLTAAGASPHSTIGTVLVTVVAALMIAQG
jgi:hypothetical protein